MLRTNPEVGETFLLKSSAGGLTIREYKVVSRGRMKFDGKWHESVNYISTKEDSDGTIYTRTLADFKQSFKRP